MKLPLMKHQLDYLEKSKGHTNFAIFAEMGLGKSVMLLADAERAYNDLDIDCLFILAPKGVYRNWSSKEIPLHLSIPHDIFIWSASLTENQQAQLYREVFRANYRLKVILLNIESLISKRAFKFSEKVLTTLRVMLAIDESTVIKNPQSKRTDAAFDLSELAKMRRILTGSPITKSPYDMYAQAKFLDEKLLGFSSFLNFRHYYAIIEKGYSNAMVMRWNPETRKKEMQRASYEKIVGFKNLDQLNERIQPWSYRCLKKDCLDLPDKVYVTRDVELTPEQKKAYNEMKHMWIVEVEQGSITATIALTKSMKLHQILCGHVKNDDGQTIHIKSNRVEELMTLLSEVQDQKIIIFCNFRQDAANVKVALTEVYGSNSIVEFHGGVSDNNREIAKQRIQQDPTCHFLIGSKSAVRGLTLTACTLIVFFSYDFDRESWTQAEDRVHRIGMTKCTIVHLKVPDSIDEKILLSHRTKGEIAEDILDTIRDLPDL